jgi:bacteriocin biosynthesis cyclodehydratase domain-containing protein
MSLIVPALDPGVSATPIAEDLTIVIGDDGVRALPGRLFPLILRLVDGRRSVLEIADALEDRATIVDVAVGVSELIDEGVLLDAARPARDPIVVRAANAAPARAPSPDARASIVALDGVDRETADVFSAGLHRDGVEVLDSGAPGALPIVLADSYAAPALDAFNRESLRTASRWLLVRPLGAVPWVGPLFNGAIGSPCWQCLAARLTEGCPVSAYVSRHYPGASLRRYRPPGIAGAIAEAARVAAGALMEAGGSEILRAVDTRTGSVVSHRVAKRSDCPACGGGGPSLPASFARHISPITGIVHRLSSWSHADFPAHVAVADHLFGPEIELADSISRGCCRRSAGGGASAGEARVAALGEALERYSGVYRNADAGRRSTYAALCPAAIHPNEVMGFSAAQLRDRDRWNAVHASRYTRVAELFDEGDEYAWTPLGRLVRAGSAATADDEAVRWLPTACCYFGVVPERERAACFGGSNGCAAGKTLDDAIVRGFLELVERDAVGIWWHNRLDRPGVELATVPDGFVQSVAGSYARANRTLGVLDIATDLGIPSFAAVSRDAATGDRLTLGFGAHFDPLRALRHALREINLFLPELVDGRRRPLFAGPAPDGSYLDAAGTRPWSSWERTCAGGGRAPVVELAKAHALQVLVLDQTRADVGIPVARVVVPGLCHFWPRFGTRRLYTVPVDMGWRRRPTRESDFNPSFILL